MKTSVFAKFIFFLFSALLKKLGASHSALVCVSASLGCARKVVVHYSVQKTTSLSNSINLPAKSPMGE